MFGVATILELRRSDRVVPNRTSRTLVSLLMASSSVQAGALLQILKQHAATRKQDRRSDEIPVSTSRSQELESLLIPLSQPVLPANFLAESASRVLDSREKSREESSGSDAQLQEEEDLEWDVTARLLVNTYGRALEDLSKQAREAEDESQWWESIERSRRAAVWYLIQSTCHAKPWSVAVLTSLFLDSSPAAFNACLHSICRHSPCQQHRSLVQ